VQQASHVVSYYFTDDIKSARSYYRVLIITFAGSIEYSPVVYLKATIAPYELAVFPNPVTDKLNLQINIPDAQEGTMKIYTITGKVVYAKVLSFKNGQNDLKIFLPGLAKGVYALQLILKSKTLNKLFVHE
jgi:hypothetical protein